MLEISIRIAGEESVVGHILSSAATNTFYIYCSFQTGVKLRENKSKLFSKSTQFKNVMKLLLGKITNSFLKGREYLERTETSTAQGTNKGYQLPKVLRYLLYFHSALTKLTERFKMERWTCRLHRMMPDVGSQENLTSGQRQPHAIIIEFKLKATFCLFSEDIFTVFELD
jgi:hypothetical protein